jgi:hypothetical protein
MKSELSNIVRISEAKPLIRRGYQALFVGTVLTIGLGIGAQSSMAQTTTTAPSASSAVPSSAASTVAGAATDTTVPAAISAPSETTAPAVISTPSEPTMVTSDASDSLPVGGIDAGFGGSSKGVSPVQVVALVGFVFVAAFGVGKFAAPSKAKTSQKKPH